MTPQTHPATTRLSYALIGAVAGLSAWALIDVVPDLIENARIVLFVVSLGLGFLSVLLALLGPVRLIPAASAALGMALPAAGLLFWASFRYLDFDLRLGPNYWLAAYGYLLAVAVPFVVAEMERHGGWRHYGLLFDAAWALVVRIAAAWLFVGIVWGVLLLSDSLLQLVGLQFIQELLKIDAVPWLISGVALGIGLAIVQELRDVVSPFLLIQLLRVLLPALLVVLAVFILALPFRGLGNLFGQFSAAITLLIVTIAGITLVTTAIHRDDALSVQGRVMRSATWALSVILPAPAILALWAVWMRVDQYGLTPDRIAALVAGGVTAIYALAYAGAALRRVSWSGRQRRVNRGMALLTLVIAAAWLTPILNAERLSVASQMARIEKGVPSEEMALWEMAHLWGVAGERGLTKLEARGKGEGDETLVALIDKARTHTQYWQFTSDRDEGTTPPLDGVIPLRPEGITLFPRALDGLHSDQRRMILEACQRRTPGGHPGCVLVLAEFEPERAGQQAIGLFLTGANSVQMMSFTLEDDVLFSEGYPRDLISDAYPAARPQIISDIIEGRYSITPAPRNVLDVGGMWLFPQY